MCKGIKEHQHLGFSQEELANKSEKEEIHESQWQQCFKEKEVAHHVKITETSNRTVMGDLRHTVSEEWQGPPNYNRFDSE